jgi:site-specific DNA-adenine methylase
MKNHFYIPYCGNKRQEVKHIYDNIDFTDITTVIEPFCGSCAMSYYISTQREGLKYILNDNNKYLKEMYELMLDDNKIEKFEKDFEELVKSFEGKKDVYIEVVKKKDLLSWFIKNKVYNITPGIFPIPTRNYKRTIDLKSFPIYNFFVNNDITFSTDCGLSIYKKYKNSKNNLILLDPPYMKSCNDLYLDASVNIYEYLYDNNIDKEKAKIILILENMWIIKLLFSTNKKLYEYDKMYDTTKKKTTHIIIGKN